MSLSFGSTARHANSMSVVGWRQVKIGRKRFLGMWAALFAVVGAASTQAQPLLPEASGVATIEHIGDHAVWVGDRILEHNVLFDGDTGDVLGMIDSPTLLTAKLPMMSRERGEIYSVDIVYSRGNRGERLDFISIYDMETFEFVDEIMLPTSSSTSNASYPYNDEIGERFLGVFNQFPTASMTIIDAVERKFVEEIVITGCAGIYPVDDRRFATLCGNGTALQVTIDDTGHKAGMVASEPFFDSVKDPVFMAAGRDGLGWVFVSFEGMVHRVDFSESQPRVEEAWSLLGTGDSGWRPGGFQHVALHEGMGRLYVAMHEGGAGSHKDPGPEVWAFDLKERKRVLRITPPNLTAAFLAGAVGMDPSGFTYALMEMLLPDEGVHAVAVSRDVEPLLFMRNANLGAVAVIDARTGETLRVITEAGLVGPTLGAQ